MVLGRSHLCAVAILLLLAGCASFQNTLAQDRTWAAYAVCRQVPGASGATIDRVEPDGRWWWSARADSYAAANVLNPCMQAELAAWRTSNPPRTLAVASPQSANLSVPPVWKPGDEWAYQYDGPAGKGTYVWSVDREEAIDGVPHYVIKTGTREIFYRKSDFASTRETVDGAIVVKNTPSRLNYVWPMHVGQTWEQIILEERPVARETTERVDSVTVEAEETVTVPAGTFKTLKVVRRNKKTGATRYEAWYSLELRHVVKLRENLESGLRVRELIAFKLR